MKKNTHPKYQKVLFVDSTSGYRFVCGSTLHPEGKEVFEGVEYPVSYLSISSSSHPFFTGSKQLVDSEGRVEKYKKRFGGRGLIQPVEAKEEAAAPVASVKAAPAPEKKAPEKKPAAPAPKKAEKKDEKAAPAKKK